METEQSKEIAGLVWVRLGLVRLGLGVVVRAKLREGTWRRGWHMTRCLGLRLRVLSRGSLGLVWVVVGKCGAVWYCLRWMVWREEVGSGGRICQVIGSCKSRKVR